MVFSSYMISLFISVRNFVRQVTDAGSPLMYKRNKRIPCLSATSATNTLTQHSSHGYTNTLSRYGHTQNAITHCPAKTLTKNLCTIYYIYYCI